MTELKITLKAARVNAGFSQNKAAQKLSEYFGKEISRSKITGFEKEPEKVPMAFGKAFSDIYRIPMEAILFTNESTERYILKEA